MISANRTEARMKWALDRFRTRVRTKLKAAMKDGRLPLTQKPGNELEELDMLQQKMPQIQMILAQPPDPMIEAQRSQAQEDYQRWLELSMKLRGNNAAYG